MRARRGTSRLGCLLMLLAVAAAGYLGLGVAEAYWRFYSFRDAMAQEARFAAAATDAQIVGRLRSKADSLGLPERAGLNVRVRRAERTITIWSEYRETLEYPGVTRQLRFAPRVVREF